MAGGVGFHSLRFRKRGWGCREEWPRRLGFPAANGKSYVRLSAMKYSALFFVALLAAGKSVTQFGTPEPKALRREELEVMGFNA